MYLNIIKKIKTTKKASERHQNLSKEKKEKKQQYGSKYYKNLSEEEKENIIKWEKMPHYNHKKKYICSGSRAFKSQRVGCQTITISIQKIILIHKFILKVQQILGSHKLKSYVYF